MHIDILRLGHPVLHSPGRGALALFVAVYAADLRKKGASGPAPGAASKIGCQLPAISHRRGRSWKMFCISDHSAGETKWPQKTSSQRHTPRRSPTCGECCGRSCLALGGNRRPPGMEGSLVLSPWDMNIPGLVNIQKAIENGHLK